MNPCPDDLPLASTPTTWQVAWIPLLVLTFLLGALVFYELWAPKHGLPTITEWLHRTSGWKKWLRVIGGTALIVTAIWHLVFGGPL